MTAHKTLRLGTRGSLLARTQSQSVAAAIEKAQPAVQVELVLIKTTGDQVQDRPLAEIGGKGLFTKEIELALLRNEIDLAVHSYKDVPVTMPLVDQSELIIAAVPSREDPRDVLVTRSGAVDVQALPAGARVGTASLRRRCQLLEQRPDLVIEPIRGNIDTRLKKLHDGEYDAIVLAFAGLKRVGMFDADLMTVLPVDQMTPAPGQGALAIQARSADTEVAELLAAIHDPAVARCVEAEREFVRLLNGDCHSPIGAYAVVQDNRLTLTAALGQPGGALPVARTSVVNDDLDPLATARKAAAAIQAPAK